MKHAVDEIDLHERTVPNYRNGWSTVFDLWVNMSAVKIFCFVLCYSSASTMLEDLSSIQGRPDLEYKKCSRRGEI